MESTLWIDSVGTGTITFGRRNELLVFGGLFAEQMRLAPGTKPVRVTPAQPYSAGDVRVSANRRGAARLQRFGRVDSWDLLRGTHSIVKPHDPLRLVGSAYYKLGVLDNGDVALGLATGSLTASGSPMFGRTFIVSRRTGAARRLRYEASAQLTEATSDGRLLLARGEFLDVIRVRDMKRLARTRLPGERIVAATSTPGGTIFFGSRGGTVWRWSGRSADEPTPIAKLGSVVLALAARSDARLVFAGTLTDRRLIDVQLRRSVALPLPDTYRTLSGVFSPDGSELAISDSATVAAHLVSVALNARQACAIAGDDIDESAWRDAIGMLPIKAPRCR